MTKEIQHMSLNYKYTRWTGKTCAQLESTLMDNMHMILGISTESGELQDIFKKHIAYGKEIDWINVKEELGDMLFYIASFCRINGLDLDEIIKINMEKLESRYPEKFTQYHANNRNLDKERSILEGSSK
jgi:NTP pyrophosphatase (non-canonical NTP hydrolase)